MGKLTITKPGLITTVANILAADDHYAILGLTSNASEEEIKSAYLHRISPQVHPDKCTQNDAYHLNAEEKDQEVIQSAYARIYLALNPTQAPVKLSDQSDEQIEATLKAAFEAAFKKAQNAYTTLIEPTIEDDPRNTKAKEALKKAAELADEDKIKEYIVVRPIYQPELRVAFKALKTATQTAGQNWIASAASNKRADTSQAFQSSENYHLMSISLSIDAGSCPGFVSAASSALEHYNNVSIAAQTVERYIKIARQLIETAQKVSKDCTFTTQHAEVLANYYILQAKSSAKEAQNSYDKALAAARVEAKRAAANASSSTFAEQVVEENIFASTADNTGSTSTSSNTTAKATGDDTIIMDVDATGVESTPSSVHASLSEASVQGKTIIPCIPKAQACSDISGFIAQVQLYAERDIKASTCQKTINAHINRQEVLDPASTLTTSQMLWLHLAASKIGDEKGFSLYVPIIIPRDNKKTLAFENARKEKLKWQYALEFCGNSSVLWGHTLARVRQAFPTTLSFAPSDSTNEATPFQTLRSELSYLYAVVFNDELKIFKELYEIWVKPLEAQAAKALGLRRTDLNKIITETRRIIHGHINIHLQKFYANPKENNLLNNADKARLFKDNLSHELATLKDSNKTVQNALTELSIPQSRAGIGIKSLVVGSVNTVVALATGINLSRTPYTPSYLKNAVSGSTTSAGIVKHGLENLSHLESPAARYKRLKEVEEKAIREETQQDEIRFPPSREGSLNGGSDKEGSDGGNMSDSGSVDGDAESGSPTTSTLLHDGSNGDNVSDDGNKSDSEDAASSTSLNTAQSQKGQSPKLPASPASAKSLSSSATASIIANAGTAQSTFKTVPVPVPIHPNHSVVWQVPVNDDGTITRKNIIAEITAVERKKALQVEHLINNATLVHNEMNAALEAAGQSAPLTDEEISFMQALHNDKEYSLYSGFMFDYKKMLDKLDLFNPTCAKLIARIREYRAGDQNATTKAALIADLEYISHLPNDPAFHIAYHNWYRPIQHKIDELDNEMVALEKTATIQVQRTNKDGIVENIKIRDAAVNWQIASTDRTKEKLATVLSDTNKATKNYYDSLPAKPLPPVTPENKNALDAERTQREKIRATNTTEYAKNIVKLKPDFDKADKHRDPLAAFFKAICAAVTTAITGLFALANSGVRNTLLCRTTTGARVVEGCDNIQSQMAKPAIKIGAG